jgi:predicted CoA-substrate-specific enzyme activase
MGYCLEAGVNVPGYQRTSPKKKVRMASSTSRVGLDVGGVFVKAVVLDPEGRVTHRVARRHHGNPVSVVGEEFRRLNIEGPVAVGITGAYAHLVAGGLNLVPVDLVNAEIKAVRKRFPDVRNVINVGGSSVTLIQLDSAGNFMDYSANSLCAAGTGSFLDQQADRLGIKYEEMKDFAHHEAPPPIATRCSVFAKSDLIHRQQEGYDKAALWCGLCKSMTGTFLNTLLRGRPLKGLTVLTGGVSQNREVLHWLKARYGDQVHTFDDAAYSCAVGAAHMTNGHVDDLSATIGSLRDAGQRAGEAPRRPRLEFRKTRYPSFDIAEAYADESGNEVRVTAWPETKTVPVYLGIDVGSTSTKVVLMDADEKVLADIYRRTSGDPIQATKALFAAIEELGRRRHAEVKVLGASTTGSGRKLVGHVIGADLVVNEITAHLSGAAHVDPNVDTIFEIGGQDSKYICAKDGRIFDSNMNYVCAAGTGSFVEEQAKKLGLKLEEIGDVVMGIAPPVTSDRCTVFMEQDVDRLLRQGYTREECMAAVLCSVVKNYFTKVVGRRRVSRERIFFQGATARNKGLVAAFENLMNVEMVVSPYCHVMGSYGAALLVKRAMAGKASRFKGLDLSRRNIGLRSEPCNLCANHCKITFAEIEGEPEQPSWGYMCGRDPGEERVRVHREFAPFQKRLGLLFAEQTSDDRRGMTDDRAAARAGRNPSSVVHRPSSTQTIGIPRSLTTYSLYPLWREFFRELGFKVALSGRTDAETVRLGNELSAAEFCFPIKVAQGQAASLARRKDVDFIFMPHTICAQPNPRTTNSYFCPYVQSFPSIERSALAVHGVDASRLLTPVVDFSLRPRMQIAELENGLAGRLGVTRSRIGKAWRKAQAAQAEFERRNREEGARILREVEASGKPAIVILGRPYNTLDLGVNLALPQKIADLGLTVIPMDMLPYDIEKLHPYFGNMFWAYGQQMLAAAEFVRHHPNLYGIYFTNFSCGPDSFLLSFAEEMMGAKPFLALELDEHGGDAGYLTRIEAFLDVIRAWTPREQPRFSVPVPETPPEQLGKRTLWIPNMHPIGGPLMAAGLRAGGFERAESLPPETHEAFELGRSLTRGSECLPTACTTGAFVQVMRSRGLAPKDNALFMPSSDGPCRFGQYNVLQRLIVNRLGLGEVAILSPSCKNSYQGLSQKARQMLWHGILCADTIWKAGCKVRPYEKERGATDRAMREGVEDVARIMETGRDFRPAFGRAVRRVAAVPAEKLGTRPLVGIVGEIYVRCDVFSNDEVIRAIERFGGEAWLAPLGEWVLYTAEFHRWVAGRRPLDLPSLASAHLKNFFIQRQEHEAARIASPFLDDRREPPIREVVAEGRKFLPMNFSGEALITLGRAVIFARQGASLIVNVAPFGCMPGTITSALCREIQAQTGVPIISLFYDGEPGMNQRLEVFLASLSARSARKNA